MMLAGTLKAPGHGTAKQHTETPASPRVLVPLITGPPVQTAGVRVLEFAAPGQNHIVSVSNPGPGPLSFFGVSHELMKPGIVYDALGLPGSTASTLASYEQGALMQQVSARKPDLFVFFFGTNENGLSQSAVEEMTASYPLLFSRPRPKPTASFSRRPIACASNATAKAGVKRSRSTRSPSPWSRSPSSRAALSGVRAR